jgi:hypothetical protein
VERRDRLGVAEGPGRLGRFLAQLPVVPHEQAAIEPGGSNVAILYHN